MGALYRFMRKGESDQVRKQVKDRQVEWLNARFGICGIPKSGTVPKFDQHTMAFCLEQLFYLRIEEMRIWLGPAGRRFYREFRGQQ